MQESDMKKIKDLVAAAETETALDELVKMLSKDADKKDFVDECLKIQAQQFTLKQEKIRGVLSGDKSSRRQNLINHRLFELLKQIEKGEKPGSLSFKKQNPLLFYALHVVASLAICGLLGLFVNKGFVSGREEWGLKIMEKDEWVGNVIIVLLVGTIPAIFVLMACFQFFPFFVETGFSREVFEKYGYALYGNALYYIIPSKFIIFHQIVVAATISFYFLILCVLIFSFGIYILREILHLSFGGQHISFGEFIRRNEENDGNGLLETLVLFINVCWDFGYEKSNRLLAKVLTFADEQV